MASTQRPLIEVTDEALRLLNKELGVTDTLRFLGQFSTGHGNYTEDRKALFHDLSEEEIVAASERDKSE